MIGIAWNCFTQHLNNYLHFAIHTVGRTVTKALKYPNSTNLEEEKSELIPTKFGDFSKEIAKFFHSDIFS